MSGHGKFVYGLVVNKWTKGSALVFITGYFAHMFGYSVAKTIMRLGVAWGGEVAASGFFGHQGRAIASLARTTPGQIAIGGVVGYGLGMGVGYYVTKKYYGQEGADLFLDVWTPGGEVGILTKEAWVDVVGPSLVVQSERAMVRQTKLTAAERLEEEVTSFLLGPFWGPAYKFFKD
jgi:hypothetical protein